MNPYEYVKEAVMHSESLLSLCCGIGRELDGLSTADITAVDIVPQYLERLNNSTPSVKTILEDALEYAEKQPDNSVDIISIIDGIEHMEKDKGLKLITEMKRVSRKRILLFTTEGFVRNEPHNAWGIEGGDEHQTHKSGWTTIELEDLGFDLLRSAYSVSQHDEPYRAIMMQWVK